MKSYRAFLEELSLYNSPEIQKLVTKKSCYDKFLANLYMLEKQSESIINQIQHSLIQAQNKTVASLSNLNQEFQYFLSKNSEGIQPLQFQCGCGFNTKIQQQYSDHFTKNYKHKIIGKLGENSSHFVTFLGNVYPLNSFSKNFISRTSQIQLAQNQKISSSFPQSTHITIKQQKKCMQIDNKQQDRVSRSSQMKTKIKQKVCQSSPKLDNELITLKKQQDTKNDKNGAFYCGACQTTFPAYKSFSAHLRVHDYIINENSSHIILRRKNRPAEAMAAKSTHNTKQRFVCPCNNKNYSRDEFVTHVFKWHKGITPRK